MRIVVSLTTIPTREKDVIKAIKSIREGTVVPNVIYVNVPEWYPRFRSCPEVGLIQKITEAGGYVITCKDYGSLTKLVPILKIEKDPATLIVVIDDDMIYGPRLIEGLVKGHDEFKCPVGYSGIAYPETAIKHLGRVGFLLAQGHGVRTEILECAFGVLFPRWALDGFPVPEPFTEDSDPAMYLSDDYVFSKFFDSKLIQKKVVCYSWIGRKGDDWTTIWTQDPSSQTWSLSRDGNLERYLKLNL
jgi:hypothetical protein